MVPLAAAACWSSAKFYGTYFLNLFDWAERALNFAAHAKRFGHDALLITAVGTDELGEQAEQAITSLGLDPSFVQKTDRFKTGTAAVWLGPGDQTSFIIERLCGL
jgi:sugar/nucleoside kinase (ribokinase family)